MVEELVPFTAENIKNSINAIKGDMLLYFNDYDVKLNFTGNIINAFKNMYLKI